VRDGGPLHRLARSKRDAQRAEACGATGLFGASKHVSPLLDGEVDEACANDGAF
jgi:hypothetical protein